MSDQNPSTTSSTVNQVNTPLIAWSRNKYVSADAASLWTGEAHGIGYCVEPLESALATTYTDDAHFVTYVVSSRRWQPRLKKMDEAALLEHGISISHYVLVADVDMPQHQRITPEAIDDAQAKLAQLPSIGWYTSRGGLRILQPLTRPVSPAHYEHAIGLWLPQHQAVLGDAWVVDLACKDWTRHFRLPRVVRDGAPTSPTIDLSRMRPVDPCAPPPPRPPRAVEDRPRPTLTSDRARILERAQKYVGQIEHPQCGTGSCDAAVWNVAVHLRGFGLDEGDALELLVDWASGLGANCEHRRPERLRRKITDVYRSSETEVGFHLKNDVHQARVETTDEGPGWSVIDLADELAIQAILHPAQSAANTTVPPRAEKPQIILGLDPERINNQAIRVLAGAGCLYVRGTALVELAVVEREAKAHAIKKSRLGEHLATAIQYITVDPKRGHVPCLPPKMVVDAIHERGHWPQLPPLHAIIDHPYLRPDGTVQLTAGYDKSTGTYCTARGPFLPVLDHACSREAAMKAANALLSLVEQFPFVAPAHRSTWLADVLTLFARPAIDGNIPLFVNDANTPGAGKTKLFAINTIIATGRDLKITPYTPGDEGEDRKRLTSLLMEAPEAVTFDNVTGPFGSGALDALLTTGEWQDRVLGVSQMVSLKARSIFRVTGNNIQFRNADTARRGCYLRLQSEEERPGERTDLKIPRLEEHVRRHRFDLVHHVLMILRSYVLAGKPKPAKFPSWGSFEQWSDLVRGAIVWLGLPDPAHTRETLRENTETDSAIPRDFLEGWLEVCEAHGTPISADSPIKGITVESAMDVLLENENEFRKLRSALAGLCKTQPGNLPPAKTVSYRLRGLNGKVGHGMIFSRNPGGERLWYVRSLDGGPARVQSNVAPTKPDPHDDPMVQEIWDRVA